VAVLELAPPSRLAVRRASLHPARVVREQGSIGCGLDRFARLELLAAAPVDSARNQEREAASSSTRSAVGAAPPLSHFRRDREKRCRHAGEHVRV
jgi:hypothetical protein